MNYFPQYQGAHFHFTSFIRFVDLAGNERWEDCILHDQARIQEMKHINMQLGNLKECTCIDNRSASYEQNSSRIFSSSNPSFHIFIQALD